MRMNKHKNPLSIFHDLKIIKPPSPYWPESANVYIFEDESGISLFDVGCGSINSVDRLFSALRDVIWKSKPINKIILSHAHPDHMGAMKILLSEVLPESIILHEKDLSYSLDPKRLMFSCDIPLCNKHLKELSIKDEEGWAGIEFDLISYFSTLNCAMCDVRPDTIVVEGDFIQVGDYDLEVFHTPGHAPGHISLYDRKKRMLLAGDIMGDVVAWYSPSSGGAVGYIKSLEKMAALDIDLILPSHGHVIRD